MDNKQNEDFEVLWFSLTPKERKIRVEKSISIIRKVAYKQVKLLKEYEESSAIKDVYYLYVFRTLEDILDNFDFVLKLGKGSSRRFAPYPTRAIIENTFRLEYFTKQSADTKNDIATREFLRVIKRFYDKDNDEINRKSLREMYDGFAQGGQYPSIDKAKDDDPFPNMYILTKDTIFSEKNWYFQYQILCEATHRKLVGIITSQDEVSEYVNSLMYLQNIMSEVIKLTDLYLNNVTQLEVINAIKNADAVIKKPKHKNKQ